MDGWRRYGAVMMKAFDAGFLRGGVHLTAEEIMEIDRSMDSLASDSKSALPEYDFEYAIDKLATGNLKPEQQIQFVTAWLALAAAIGKKLNEIRIRLNKLSIAADEEVGLHTIIGFIREAASDPLITQTKKENLLRLIDIIYTLLGRFPMRSDMADPIDEFFELNGVRKK
jgi:hypothetical protein